MTTAEIESLLERVRQVTRPDRELDADIDAALFGGYPSHRCHDRTRRSYSSGYIHNADDGSNLTQGGRHACELTASLDACHALIERVLPGWAYGLDSGPKTRLAFVDRHDHADRMFGARFCAEAHTQALALLAALLLALLHQASEKGMIDAD